MIRILDTSEFMAMVALAEYRLGHRVFHQSIDNLLECVYAIEAACPDVRINFSRKSIDSYHTSSHIIVLHHDELSIQTEENISILRWYEPEEEVREKCMYAIRHQNK